MLRPGETRADMESDARVSELLAPWGGPAAMTIERKAVYRFHARTAKAFSKGRVFLAGDAAHITPPFVGQGLVAGLRDAANLSWKLAWVLQGRASPRILDSYDEERRPHAKAMIDLAKFMGRLIMPQQRRRRAAHPWNAAPHAPHGRDAPVFRRSGNQAQERVPARIVRPGTLGLEAHARRSAASGLGSGSRRRGSSERRSPRSVR